MAKWPRIQAATAAGGTTVMGFGADELSQTTSTHHLLAGESNERSEVRRC